MRRQRLLRNPLVALCVGLVVALCCTAPAIAEGAVSEVPVNTPQSQEDAGQPATERKDVSALTTFLVILGMPLIGLAVFLLFPFIGIGIALAVIGKELWKLVRPKRQSTLPTGNHPKGL